MKLLRKLQSSLFLPSYIGEICIALYFSKYSGKSLKWSGLVASTLETPPQVCKEKPKDVNF